MYIVDFVDENESGICEDEHPMFVKGEVMYVKELHGTLSLRTAAEVIHLRTSPNNLASCST